MDLENIERKGQLQYNTGVVFFKNSPVVKSILKRWMELGLKYKESKSPDISLMKQGNNIFKQNLGVNHAVDDLESKTEN